MNRSLVIPGGICLISFVALVVILYGAAQTGTLTAREMSDFNDHQKRAAVMALTAGNYPAAILNTRTELLIDENVAHHILTALVAEYMHPWREWEQSSHHSYSRAAPRQIPSISAEIDLSPAATGKDARFWLGTIVINTGLKSQPTGSVIDRLTKQVWMFSDGNWLTGEQWAATAPQP
jgi:hypothetical protein